MKSLLVTALLVAGLQTATTKTKSTRLRAEPRHGAPVVATVPEGTTLQMKGVAAEPYLVVEYEGRRLTWTKAGSTSHPSLRGRSLTLRLTWKTLLNLIRLNSPQGQVSIAL